MKVKNVSIIAVVGVLVFLSGMPVLSSGSITNYANARYANTNTQSQANANDCTTGTNCAITSPQTQGDGTANSPTNLQISKFNEEQEEGVEGGIDVVTDHMTVINCEGESIVVWCDVISPSQWINLSCLITNPSSASAHCDVLGFVPESFASGTCFAPLPRPVPEQQEFDCTWRVG